jgi:hypothetical protein
MGAGTFAGSCRCGPSCLLIAEAPTSGEPAGAAQAPTAAAPAPDGGKAPATSDADGASTSSGTSSGLSSGAEAGIVIAGGRWPVAQLITPHEVAHPAIFPHQPLHHADVLCFIEPLLSSCSYSGGAGCRDRLLLLAQAAWRRQQPAPDQPV